MELLIQNFREYNEKHCWQYDIRLKNLEDDLRESEISKFESQLLKVKHFKFQHVSKEDKEMCKRINDFIIRHEWLGKMPTRPTHRFIATYKGHLAGVQVMATPNAFSYLLGAENSDLEKLIARGASISWSPKNLGSWLIMKSINWMVQNTEFRYFTAYSDTEAGELGSIYQGCNFIYLGKNSGGRYEYYDESNPQRGWFSDRLFRKVGQYKKYALHLGITWDPSWNTKGRMHWDRVPSMIHAQLAQASVEYRDRCKRRKLNPKHKYVMIKGQTKAETKKLLECFYKANPKLKPKGPNTRPGLPYPKVRGE